MQTHNVHFYELIVKPAIFPKCDCCILSFFYVGHILNAKYTAYFQYIQLFKM